MLPSFLKRKRGAAQSAKRRKTLQTWDRDIVCLPKQDSSIKHIAYPRGKYREQLGRNGLLGKIRLSSDMTVQEVQDEIRSAFKQPMKDRQDFPYLYLQPTGCGSRSLTVPALSSSFEWNVQQVAKLGGAKGIIYIMAQDSLYTQFEVSFFLESLIFKV